MEKGRGSGREREACSQGNGCSMQCRGTMVHWLQQYFLQKVRAGVKHCQPSLQAPMDSQVLGLRTLSDNQCSPHRSGAFSS